MTVVRAAVSALVALALADCASEQLSSASSPASTDNSMVGRWTLTVPNAPSCGMEFGGAADARSGRVAPDGGCPGNLYKSRRWAIEGAALTIADDENQPLAQLKSSGARFEGRSNTGLPVTLAR